MNRAFDRILVWFGRCFLLVRRLGTTFQGLLTSKSLLLGASVYPLMNSGSGGGGLDLVSAHGGEKWEKALRALSLSWLRHKVLAIWRQEFFSFVIARSQHAIPNSLELQSGQKGSRRPTFVPSPAPIKYASCVPMLITTKI